MYRYKFGSYRNIRYYEASIFLNVLVKIFTEKKEVTMKEKSIKMPVPPVDIPCAYVTVKAGATVPIPNMKYSTARIEVSLSYPCHPEKIDEVYEKVKDWVDKRVSDEYNELIGKTKSDDLIEDEVLI